MSTDAAEPPLSSRTRGRELRRPSKVAAPSVSASRTHNQAVNTSGSSATTTSKSSGNQGKKRASGEAFVAFVLGVLSPFVSLPSSPLCLAQWVADGPYYGLT